MRILAFLRSCPRLVVGECVDVPGDQSSEPIGMLLFKTSQDLGVVEFSRPKDNPKRPFPTALISPIEVPHLRLSPSASHPQKLVRPAGSCIVASTSLRNVHRMSRLKVSI
jgi:hypothetical protein